MAAFEANQAQCDRHQGDAYPPRCTECDVEVVKAAGAVVARRLDRNPAPTTTRAVWTSQSRAYEQPVAAPALLDLDVLRESM
jgi:hypothetical protein